MRYELARGIVPPAGIRPGRMILKFRGWPRDMATQMCLWHIVMAEQPYVRLPLLRQMVLEHCQCHIGVAPTEIYGMSGSISLTRHLLLSSGAVRRNSLRCAPFGPPTVSCVLAHARTCLRQAPPTSRGRGLATSAALHHLLDDMSIKAFIIGKRCKKTSFFTPFHQI